MICGHPDGVGDLLDLGIQADHVRGELAERDPSRDGRGGLACPRVQTYPANPSSEGSALATFNWTGQQDHQEWRGPAGDRVLST